MVLISLRKRRTRSLGGFTQYHSGSVMTHLMGNKKRKTMCFSLFPFFLNFFFKFLLTFSVFPLSLFSSLSLLPSFSLSFLSVPHASHSALSLFT